MPADGEVRPFLRALHGRHPGARADPLAVPETNGIMVFRDTSGGGQTACRLRLFSGGGVSHAADIGDKESGSNGLGLSEVNPPLIQIQDSGGACCTSWQPRVAAVRILRRAIVNATTSATRFRVTDAQRSRKDVLRLTSRE